MDQTVHRMATKEREESKRTTKQKIAIQGRRESPGSGKQHPAVDGQSVDERRKNWVSVKAAGWGRVIITLPSGQHYHLLWK